MIQLETPRLILRDHQPEDLESHHALLSDPKVMYYLQDMQSHSLEDSQKDLERSIQQGRESLDKRVLYFLRIEEKESGKLVGETGYTVTRFTPVGKLVHMGYFSFPEFWGRGMMTEAVRELFRFAFLENHVYRITTGCLEENPGSRRVMEKNGMIQEAVHKDWEWHDGRMKTRLEYRMLSSDYQEAQGSGRQG